MDTEQDTPEQDTTSTEPNAYERKQEARRERLERASDRANEAATAAFNRAHSATAGIPFGQPILVGHHSESRHRNAIKRSDNAMGKAVALTKQAERLAQRAASVGTGGISSDDPEAVEKLTDKRTDLERKRDRMVAVNKAYRKRDAAALAALGLSLEAVDKMVADLPSYLQKQPYASFELTNIGARIRDAAKRVERIEAVSELTASVETINGATITIDPDDNRVNVAFPSRLSRDDYKMARTFGFVWSPTRSAFTRKITGHAIYNARELAKRVTVAS